MKRYIFLSLMFIFCPTVFAHPPAEIKLNYDTQAKSFNIQMTHVVDNMKDHYIRKIYVSKNNEEPVIYNFRKQASPTEFNETIFLEAKAKDVIVVKAFCEEGGIKEASIQIPEIKKEEEALKETDASLLDQSSPFVESPFVKPTGRY